MEGLGDILAKKLIETLCDCQAVVTYRPAVVKVKTLAEKTGHHRCKALIDKLVSRKADIKMKTLGETLVEVEANAPADKLFDTR